MYGRAINFTLLAPSLWSVVEAVAQPIDTEDMKRDLFKSSDNTGFIIEIFPSKQLAGSNLEVLKAMQSLKEQAMAKVSILEGSR
tara:strand:- start:143 stop:394 length:252 start_codon:yes stop_codon:yes gene_type:complete